ncbi:MAG: uncharacterized protein JWQ09_5625 [Segetibacter sp.]|nr:uncharacterized protein [Segetibacter sp.]
MIDKLILGTVQLGIPYGINNSTGQPGVSQAMEILDFAKLVGITTLDTAKAYGNAIEIIGAYHKKSGSRFKIINKFHAEKENLEKEIRKELNVLGSDHFEAYLFHSFSDFENASTHTLNTISKLKQENIILKIGVSVYGNDQFEKAIQSSFIDVIQLPYNLLDNDSQRGNLIAEAKHKGKELHVRSVFLQGLFFMEADRIPVKIEKLKPYLEQVRKIAESESLTVHELALGYVLQNNSINKVLIGVDSLAHLKMNVKAVEKIRNSSLVLLQKINALHVKETDLLSPVNWNS